MGRCLAGRCSGCRSVAAWLEYMWCCAPKDVVLALRGKSVGSQVHEGVKLSLLARESSPSTLRTRQVTRPRMCFRAGWLWSKFSEVGQHQNR